MADEINLFTKKGRQRCLTEILADPSLPIDDVARNLLYMVHADHFDLCGGYLSDISWDFFPDHVVVAENDHNGAPILRVYTRDSLHECAADALEIARAGDDPDGDDPETVAFEVFHENFPDCEAQS